MPPDHAFRPAEAGDRGYILESWLKTYRSSPFAQKLPDFAYWSRFGHVGLVESVLDRVPVAEYLVLRESGQPRLAGEHVTVCCLPDDPSWMYGWAITEGEALHYLFVRYEFRGQGFGRLLLDAVGMGAGPLAVTHLTPDFSKRLGRKREVRFINPYRSERR